MITIFNVFKGYTQDKTISWINENAHPLAVDTVVSVKDLSFLSSELQGNTVVGLGEASHGTREFYNQKKRIIEYLITNLKYKHLSFELPGTFVEPINHYVLDGKGDLKELVRKLYLYGTEEVCQVFQLIRSYNEQQSFENKVSLSGLDREEYAGNPLTRDKFMAENIIAEYKKSKNKTIIWSHNVHLAKDSAARHYEGLGFYIGKEFGESFYVLGFDTFKGAVNVIDGQEFIRHGFVGEQGSFSDIFAHVKFTDFFISFRKTPNPFSGIKNNITNIYSNWTEKRVLPVSLGNDFDAIIFIRESNPSVKLK
ncbi:erythromycin esterase family protein [Pedobacter sp. NJ-S-72]